jgi:hypothetical protein
MGLYHKFRRLMQRNYIWVTRVATLSNVDSSPYENDAIRITQKLINDKDSTMLISPLSGKKYIKNDKFGMYVILHSSSVQIINHKYSYVVFISDKKYDKIINEFNIEVENRRQVFEKEILGNIQHSMKSIIKTLNDYETK